MEAVKKLCRLVAVLVLGTISLLSFAGPAAASEHPKWVGVAQTVLANTLPDGQISGTPVVYTQLAANGSGPATVKVPMSASGFRNLTGLGTPPITNGKAVWKLHLTGPTNGRTVAHFPASQLPFQVSATYELNGKKMWPKNIVGKSGHLKVTYDIKNITTEATTVTFKNVFGATEKRTVHVPIPMAAAFSVTFPATFTNLKAPGASASGNGNGTVAASWTLFLFDPLGGVHQSVSYQAQVTDAVIPSATLAGQAIPPADLKPLPTIHEPGAPAVPVVTVGGRLASLQVGFQMKLQQIAAKASIVLGELKAALVPVALDVSKGAAHVSSGLAALASSGLAQVSSSVTHVSNAVAKEAAFLSSLSVGASNLSTTAGDVAARLAQRAAEASAIATIVANARTRLTALPAAICTALGSIITVPPNCATFVAATPRFRLMQLKLTVLEALVVKHAAGLATLSGNAKALQALATTVSAGLAARSTRAHALSVRLAALSPQVAALAPKIDALSADAAGTSANAAKVAGSLSTALTPKTRHSNGSTIQPKQVGGGARLDAAVGKLDAAISQAGAQVDDNYAYLAALDVRASQNQLPAGNASGATAQAGAVSYSIGGANQTGTQIHLALIIGVTGLFIGTTLGLGLYRIRRGEPSSLAPPPKKPKSPKRPKSPAPAKA